jgi:hypothetical protein
MDTTHHNTAATWVTGYADYLRDAVGAADATRAHHLPIVPDRGINARGVALEGRRDYVFDHRGRQPARISSH